MFIDNSIVSTSFVNKDIRVFSGGERTPDAKLPILPNWFWTARLGLPRSINIVETRQYGKSVWTQMIFNTIKKQVSTTPWRVKPKDKNDDTDYSADILKATTFLEQPNRNGDTHGEVWGRFIHDVLEIDAGVVFKGRNPKGELVELFSQDGSRFLYDMDDLGIVHGFYQYSYRFVDSAPRHFDKDEVIYGKMGHNTESYPYGWSPLQSFVQELEVMIQSTRYNKDFFANNAIPDGIITAKMTPEELKRFQLYWKQKLAGKGHKLAFLNQDVTFNPLKVNNKDMDWLEGQKWYFHAIFAAYGLSPQEVGFYENSNRATGESQERISVKNAVKPYLNLIDSKITREILPDLLGHDKLEFEYILKDDVAEKIEHDQTMAKLNSNVLTINEVRKKEGLDPVEWGDKPFNLFMQENTMALNEQFGVEDKPEDNPKDKKEEGNPKRKDEERDDMKERDEDKDSKKLYNKLLISFMKDGK